MKAIICTGYGSPDVLQLQEVEKPIPGENDILIKVYAASATTADGMMRQGTPFYARLFLGLRKPKHPITGTGFAGVVEAVGKAVQQFQPGYRVFGESGLNFGANAEYLSMPENGVVSTLPNNMTYSEAAPICDGALTSLNFLTRVGNLQKGERVLINGASGSLGSAAVQLASHFGAEVTGVCSAGNAALVKSLGAERVIDYDREDFTRTDQPYHLIYDTIGSSSFSRCKQALTADGAYLSPVLKMPLLFQMLRTSLFGNQKAKFSATGIRPVSELRTLLQELKKLIEAGKIKTVVDKVYPLTETAEAHRYIGKGHKKGNVVLAVFTDH